MLTSAIAIAIAAQALTLLSAAQDLPPPQSAPTPPPVVRVAPPAPPAPRVNYPTPVMPDYRARELARREPETLDVRVLFAGRPLWQGEMIVNGYNQSSYNQTKSDALPIVCSERSLGSNQTSLQVGVSKRGYDADSVDRYQVSATWQRPANPTSCEQLGTRSLSLQNSVVIAPGTTATVEGDAGFIVEVRRRR